MAPTWHILVISAFFLARGCDAVAMARHATGLAACVCRGVEVERRYEQPPEREEEEDRSILVGRGALISLSE